MYILPKTPISPNAKYMSHFEFQHAISTASITKKISSKSFHCNQEVMQDSSFKFLCTDSAKLFSRELPRKAFFLDLNQTQSPSKTSFCSWFLGKPKRPNFLQDFTVCFSNWWSVSWIDLWFLKLKTFFLNFSKLRPNKICFTRLTLRALKGPKSAKGIVYGALA